MQNIMRYINLFFGLLILLVGCSSNKSTNINWQPLLNEALSQAIINEKLPEVETLFNSDSVYVFPQKAFVSKGLAFDSVLAKDLPKQIEKVKLIIIDAGFINRISSKQNISFMMISRSSIQNKSVVQFSTEDRFPKQEDYIIIDKGKLKIIFTLIKNKWILSKIQSYYG